jgi:site-specific DNA recombinase
VTIRDLLAETAILLERHTAAFRHDDELAAQHVLGQVAHEQRQLETVEAKLGGLLTAIEDGLYSKRVKIRFQQLEDQSARLRASLQIGSDHLKSLQAPGGDGSREAVIALMTELRTTDDEYAILKLRRTIGPIKVVPGSARTHCILDWHRKPEQSDEYGSPLLLG